MRPLKFRAWDNERKEMTGSFGFNNVTGEDGHEGYIDTNPNNEGINNDISPGEIGDRYILMQYTGIQDVNGVEIYESDVVLASLKADLFLVNGLPNTIKMTVEWDMRGQWSMKGKNFSMGNMWCIADYDMTVIGNIYQNPELLK